MKDYFDDEIKFSFYINDKRTELEIELEDYPLGG